MLYSSLLTPHPYYLMIDKLRVVLAGKLPPGSFIRNVVTLMTGTTFAQALMILVAPILTRSYSPEDFGVYALYTSIASILTVLACWSYDYAIVLPEHDEDAANILGLSILICLGMAGLTLIIVTFLRYPLTEILNAPGLTIWLWCMPLSVLGAGLFKAFNYWSTRRKHFKRLAVRQVTQSTITSATQIGAGITLNTGPGGLIGGLIVGQLAATSRLAWQIGKDEGEFLKSCISFKNLKRMAIRYKKFPLYDSLSGLFNMSSTMLPTLLLGYFFSPAVVGFYALGQRVLSLPMNVIGGSIAQVFFPQATKADRDGELSKITLNMFERLLAIGFVPLMLIAIVAPDLFALVFGERWWTAGEYVRWMSLWVFFQFVSSPLSTIYYVKERQRNLLLFNVVMFLLRFLVIVVGGSRGDVILTIFLLGLTGSVSYCFFAIYITYLAGIAIPQVLLSIAKQLVFGIPYCIFPLLVWYISKSSLAFVLVAVASGFVFLFIMLKSFKKMGINTI
mgnify:CR=1 FL=1